MSEDFKEIQTFGEEVGLEEESRGSIDSPYALLIEDIDRQQDRELIFEVLGQSGIDLDLESVKKQLGEGHLLVSHLNEAKAALIVDKIKQIEADIRFGLLSELRSKNLPGSFEIKNRAKPEPIADLSTFDDESKEMVLTTAPSIEGKSIQKYLGIVSTEVALAEAAVLEELSSELSLPSEKSPYDVCVAHVLKELEKKAKLHEANAVVAISFDFKFLPEKKSFLVFATGTAVKI